MRSSARGAQRIIGLVASVCAVACDATVSASLEQKECSSHGECLPGWMCSDDQVCVKKSPAKRGDSQATAPEAGLSDLDATDTSPPGSVATSCAGGTLCDGSCVDLSRSTEHCGGCDRRCATTDNGQPACNAGTCEFTCDENYVRCADGCYRLAADPLHCGSCTVTCPSVQNGTTACVEGACRATCNPGFTDCNGACVRLETDAQNCGVCGTACEADQQCAAGSCVGACPAGTSECARSCVDVMTDATNCGTCGNSCAATPSGAPVCRGGVCGTQCNSGLLACGTACIDPQSDRLNCGTCENVCPAPTVSRSHSVCAAGSCGAACDDGFVACDDQCITAALLATRNNRRTCADLSVTLDLTICQGMGQKTTYCAGECVNLTADAKHCGKCDQPCVESQSCFFSSCVNF